MIIARYWAKGKATVTPRAGRTFEMVAWGWSATSQAEAESNALAAARRVAERFQAGQIPAEGYGYPDRPAREELREEIKNPKGETIATITRNSYGALILNTRDLMFIDVDVPHEMAGARLVRKLKGLFGGDTDDPEMQTRKRIAKAAQRFTDYAFRLYRTYAGFRCAIINKPVDPVGVESQHLLEAFGADPLYSRLCKNQQCFRARLTPKYWRCGASKPPNRFPWSSTAAEEAYRVWESRYEARCAQFATCQLVEHFGSPEIHPDLKSLIELHDERSKVGSLYGLA